jgi:hypothetical protein
MRESIRTFTALGWDFDIAFPSNPDEAEDIRRITRSGPPGSDPVEEGSDLEDQLIRAVKSLKEYAVFVDDTFREIEDDSYDDYYEDSDYDDVGDAQSPVDDEKAQ